MSFRILGPGGAPVREYVEEQTKLLHLYVVRADLSAFRHVHPALGAELTPEGEDQPYVLGTTIEVPGDGKTTEVSRGDDAATADDGVVKVRLLGRPAVVRTAACGSR